MLSANLWSNRRRKKKSEGEEGQRQGLLKYGCRPCHSRICPRWAQKSEHRSDTKSLRLGWDHHESRRPTGRRKKKEEAEECMGRSKGSRSCISATTVPWPGDPHRPQASVYQSDGRIERLSAGEGGFLSFSLSLSLSSGETVAVCASASVCVFGPVCVPEFLQSSRWGQPRGGVCCGLIN